MHFIRSLLLFVFVVAWAFPAFAMDVTVKVHSFKVDFGNPYAPENLLDNDLSTAWVGGGFGPGKGQWIELDFGLPVRVRRLGIFNGHQAEGRFEEFRRIRSGRVVYPDGSETAFWLRDEPGEQVVECTGKPVKFVRIVIDDVFPKGQLIGKVKVAVSELKLYLQLLTDPKQANVKVDGGRTAAPPPLDPDKIVPEEVAELLRTFYVMQATLDPDYALLFAHDVRDRFDFQFEIFKEMQRQRGTYALFKGAKVDTSGLGFELVRREGQFAEVRTFGGYSVKVGELDKNMEEDSVFVLVKDAEGWRILELDDSH